MSEASSLRVIFVELLDEGTTAYRPVIAQALSGERFRILELPEYASLEERWSFMPGSEVAITKTTTFDGQVIEVATNHA